MIPYTDDYKASGTDKQQVKTLPKRLWALIANNLQWKLLAVVLAIGLWVGLITQDTTLTRERIFSDVPVSITNSETLRRNGFIVVHGLEEESATVRLKVDVPQQEYNDVTYFNYNPRLDLSKITEAGEQSVKVNTTSSSAYGTVTDVSPDSIPVVVDAYITNYRIPVQVQVTGDYPEGFYGTPPSVDISYVTVSGPESIVSQIARILLTYDVSSLPAREGAIRTALPFQYIDMEDHPLDSSLIEPTSTGVLLRSIVVTQELYPVKNIALNQSMLIAGVPAKGYEVKSVTVSPSTIIAAGDETTLSTLQTLFLDQAVDITDQDAAFTAEVKISRPENIVYLNADTVVLIIDIGPVYTTQTFEDIPLSIRDTPEDLVSASETTKAAVSVTGPALAMETLRTSKLKAFVSAEGLTPGTFDLPIQLIIDREDADVFTYTLTPQSIAVTLGQQQ